MKKILYLGGFEMPDKNAAAQRVLSIAKALRLYGYITKFYGVTGADDFRGEVDGFEYEACPHPTGAVAWFRYAIGEGIVDYIKQQSPDYVFLYNYPALAQERVISYCRKAGIKSVGDITEWYRPTSLPKRIDTTCRMRVSNGHLNGIIAISRYLAEYYKGKRLLQLPPLVDKQEHKWQIKPVEHQGNRINLVYIGTGSIKDRLDKIINGINQVGAHQFHLDIIGITEKQYAEIYRQKLNLKEDDLIFHGRLPHKVALAYLMGADFQVFFRDDIRVNNAGFPTKFVESISAGIPVITNRISNIADYVDNHVNSFMISRPIEDEITAVLKQVANLSRGEIESMKHNCPKEEFDFRAYADRLNDFIEQL